MLPHILPEFCEGVLRGDFRMRNREGKSTHFTMMEEFFGNQKNKQKERWSESAPRKNCKSDSYLHYIFSQALINITKYCSWTYYYIKPWPERKTATATTLNQHQNDVVCLLGFNLKIQTTVTILFSISKVFFNLYNCQWQIYKSWTLNSFLCSWTPGKVLRSFEAHTLLV